MDSLCDRVQSAISADEELDDLFAEHLASCKRCSDSERRATDDSAMGLLEQLPKTLSESRAVANFNIDLCSLVARTAVGDGAYSRPRADTSCEGVDVSGRLSQWLRRLLRSKVFVATAIPTVAAAGIAIALVSSSNADEARARVRLAFEQTLSPTRSVLPRLSYSGADRHRPPNNHMSDDAQNVEIIKDSLLSQLEQLGDVQGYAAGELLRGNPERAEQILRQVPPSPDVWSDLAAIKLSGRTEREAKRALSLVSKALEIEPQHGQALWNRALALWQLDRVPEAINAFALVVELGEPGWSQEASAMADALRRQVEN